MVGGEVKGDIVVLKKTCVGGGVGSMHLETYTEVKKKNWRGASPRGDNRYKPVGCAGIRAGM